MKNKKHYIQKFIVSFLIVFLLFILISFIVYVCTIPSFQIKMPESMCVCIDPGHGGKDTGARYQNRLEKDDVLVLSKKIAKNLEERGIKVILTRKEDKFISLEERCKIANRKKCMLFISVHRNSSESGSGMEMWIKNKPSKTEIFLAKAILEKLKNTNHISNIRGVKYGYRKNADHNYYVNANTEMPSCLAEIGFITNTVDNELFDQYLDEYALAISDSIIMTLKEMKGETII